MSKYKRITISAAKEIAKKYGKQQVIIVTWDEDFGLMHCTTYGTTKKHCAQAAKGGEFVKKALGFAPDQERPMTAIGLDPDFEPASAPVRKGLCQASHRPGEEPDAIKTIRYDHNGYENDKYMAVCAEHLHLEE